MVLNDFKISCLLFGLASLWTIGFSAICDEFFQGTIKFPPVINQTNIGVVKLCQNHVTNAGGDGPALYATLFDTTHKIPIYSANAITIDPSAPTFPRPNKNKWKRVSSALCVANLPNVQPFYSRIKASRRLRYCDQHQALNSDYSGNTKNLTRGHLCPNSIMKRDKEKQLGTFTLTNAAPQFKNSNNIDWSRIECAAEQAIIALAPNETVYIITGVSGSSETPLNNRVKIPAKFWKLVCYPGSTNKAAWAFGIVRDNVAAQPVPTKAAYENLNVVASRYFTDENMPFTDACTGAGLGEFDNFLNTNWNLTYGTINQCK